MPQVRHEPGAVGAAPAATKVEYSCPMHPQIVRDQPGSCPMCGMALEPRTVTVEEGPNPELVDMSRRFWVGLALSLPVFLLAMGDMLPGKPLHHLLSMTALNWVQLALATPVVLWCGWPFFERAWSSVIHRSPNMFTLIALGVGSAYLYSLVATVAPQLFPEGFRAAAARSMPYFDTAVVVTVLILLGQVLELKARGQTSGAIKRLLGLAPKTARAIGPTGREEDVPLDKIRVGDLLRVRPGEKVPVDGVVTEGRSSVGRVDDLGRADAGREGARQQGGRRHGQRHGRAADAGRAGRLRHAARADRAHGRRGPAQPRADRAARGSGGGVLRPGGRARQPV